MQSTINRDNLDEFIHNLNVEYCRLSNLPIRPENQLATVQNAISALRLLRPVTYANTYANRQSMYNPCNRS